MKKEFIFIGPPGSGKGTQTIMLAKDMNLPHIDTGSLLREEIARDTQEGRLADSFMSKGQLVPINVVSTIIKNRLSQADCQNGFILDGYPRSLEQAYALDDILAEIDKDTDVVPTVFYFAVDQEQLIERLVNRRSCPDCGEIYNIKTMTLTDKEKCEKCGAKLVRRDDDTEDVARKRFDTYFAQTAPLIDMYAKRNWLVEIDASKDIETIYKSLTGAIKGHVNL